MLRRKSKKKKKSEMFIRGGGSFVQIFFPLFTPIWRDCILKGEERKFVGPPLFSPPPPLNQIVKNSIFHPIFLSLFSILPVFTPTNHTLKMKMKKKVEGGGKVGLGNVNIRIISCGAGSATFWVLNFND